jgi:hypothetical protein
VRGKILLSVNEGPKDVVLIANAELVDSTGITYLD